MLSPRLPMTPHAGQWILSGSCPSSRAVATACVSCPGFHSSASRTVDPLCPVFGSWSMLSRLGDSPGARDAVSAASDTALMPAAFPGNGNSMNALDRNRYTGAWTCRPFPAPSRWHQFWLACAPPGSTVLAVWRRAAPRWPAAGRGGWLGRPCPAGFLHRAHQADVVAVGIGHDRPPRAPERV